MEIYEVIRNAGVIFGGNADESQEEFESQVNQDEADWTPAY